MGFTNDLHYRLPLWVKESGYSVTVRFQQRHTRTQGKDDGGEQSFSDKIVFIEPSRQMVKGTGTCVAKSQ